MNLSRAVNLFSKQPLICLVIAILSALIGIIFLNGWLPTSPNRPFFRDYQWIMAVLSGLLTTFFLYCAALGLAQKTKN